jgi:CrcB protein
MSLQKQTLVATESVLLVGIGGFTGSNLRYFSESLITSTLLSTAVVNIVGCFALGVLFYEGELVGIISDRGRRILGTGVLSSFTTYSTFVLDTVTATPRFGLAYLFGSYMLGFAGVLLGRQTIRWASSTWQSSTWQGES